MALMVGCDTCRRFIRNIPWERRSEISNIEICPTCKKKQQRLDIYIEKAKKKFDHQFNQILEDAKNELSQAIVKIAEENKEE